MVMKSQHGLKPLGTTLFNTSSHIREVNGRIVSYMAVLGIKQPEGIRSNRSEESQRHFAENEPAPSDNPRLLAKPTQPDWL